jgi:hypothetical protein
MRYEEFVCVAPFAYVRKSPRVCPSQVAWMEPAARDLLISVHWKFAALLHPERRTADKLVQLSRRLD